MSKQEYLEDHSDENLNDEFLILQLVIDTAGIQLHEIQTELACSTGTCVTHRFLYKRASLVALQNSEKLRQKFVQEMTVYIRICFICGQDWK